ncbi:Flavonol sulfotransferase-like protein [Triticum urartu]|uniref:Sulfotransferase n=1 Tax=Triticum urartu TaxID=4572 RepID=M7Z510_TRIUA|nr:Flavonol sulfotransferase-like protein [Triticum urartu]
MATVFPRDAGVSTPEADEAKKIYEEARRVVSTYETVPSGALRDNCRHPGGWHMIMPVMVSSMVAEQHFEARGTDVLLVTMPKCGTTWIKALLYAAARRTDDTSSILRQLASHNSHQLVPFLEAQVYTKDQIPDLSSLPAPRLFASHIPAESLPPSVVASGCKVREQEAGVDRKITEACAMKSMVNQEVNQSGTTEIIEMPMPNGVFFRRGVVGDWTNYLTPEMAGRIDEITKSKFEGTGLMLPKTISEIPKI